MGRRGARGGQTPGLLGLFLPELGLTCLLSLSPPLILCNVHVSTWGSGVELVLGLGVRGASRQCGWLEGAGGPNACATPSLPSPSYQSQSIWLLLLLWGGKEGVEEETRRKKWGRGSNLKVRGSIPGSQCNLVTNCLSELLVKQVVIALTAGVAEGGWYHEAPHLQHREGAPCAGG